MSDNNIPESERRLQEIGNQLGTPILSPTTKIQGDDGSVISSSQSNADIQGTLDSQPSSKNPLLQYIVAGAIGLGAVGVPLTVLFGLGGTPMATKPTAPEVEDTTSSLADRELENLKTQSALDIQAKSEPQTVAQTPKPAPTPTPAPTVAAPKPKPQPVVKTDAPQPRTIAVPPPTVVAVTPATVARPVPIPVTRPVARPMPRPTPAPVITQPRPNPIPVATQPAQPVKPAAPEQPPLSFEQASALGMFGGDNDKSDNGAMTLASDDSSSLTLALPVGANVAAHTVTPYTSLSSRNSATNGTETPLSVQLDQPIQLSQGFNLPAGTIVQFGATVADNGAVTATSKSVFIDGTEIKVPVGAFALTASNSAALVANQRSLREGELSGADTTAAMWGAAGGLGKALVDSSNTSVVNTSGLGTSVVQTNNGGVSIPGALLNGAFSPLAKAKESRANALAQELQQSSKLNEIPVRSPVRVFVAAAAAITVPVSSDVTAANTGTPAQGQVLSGGDVEQPPTMIPTKPISVVNVQPVVAPPPPTTATTQPVAPQTPATATSKPTFTPQVPITPTTQPATFAPIQPSMGIIGQSPIAPTKPNNVVNTQPQSVVPQPTITPTQSVQSTQFTPTQLIQTPTATTPSAIITSPSPARAPTQSTAITQPSVVPQQSNSGAAQPTTIPTTIETFTSEPTLISPQPATVTTTQSTFIPPQPATAPSQPRTTTAQPIQTTTTQPTITTTQSTTTQPVITEQQPTTTSEPTGATKPLSPIAPTKPNNVVNTQPQSVVPQPLAPAPIQSNSGINAQSLPIVTPAQFIEAQNTQASATQTTISNQTDSTIVPIQFNDGGSIQPIVARQPGVETTTPNPAMAPLP